MLPSHAVIPDIVQIPNRSHDAVGDVCPSANLYPASQVYVTTFLFCIKVSELTTVFATDGVSVHKSEYRIHTLIIRYFY